MTGRWGIAIPVSCLLLMLMASIRLAIGTRHPLFPGQSWSSEQCQRVVVVVPCYSKMI